MKSLDQLSDSDILTLAGPYGPALIGQELFDRAQAIRKRGDDGKLGPALTDPHYAAKQAAAKTAAPVPAPDPAATKTPPVPGTWDGITLSGLKHLAMEKGVSYRPKVERAELLQALEAAGVTPPSAE